MLGSIERIRMDFRMLQGERSLRSEGRLKARGTVRGKFVASRKSADS